MVLEIKITMDGVTVYDSDVTSKDLPAEVITLLKTVHRCEMYIKRLD